MHLAVDIMSGDLGPLSNLEGAVQALRQCPDLNLALCADKSLVDSYSDNIRDVRSRITIHHSPVGVHTDVKPSVIVRNSQITSLHTSLDLLLNKSVSGVISSANTGAYMALCLRILKMRPKIKRPAIGKILPSLYPDSYTQKTLALDLGANIECSQELLLQFSDLAVEYAHTYFKIKKPRLGILNIGTEPNKGTQTLQCAYENLIQNSSIDFLGFIEGDSLLKGVTDIIVCDGFHGNIALKTLEGAIVSCYSALKSSLSKGSFFEKIIAFLLKHQIKKILGLRFNPKRYNGALFMGLSHDFVFKSHGNADAESFSFAIKNAYDLLSQPTSTNA
jgi:phosphate acyltransferase